MVDNQAENFIYRSVIRLLDLGFSVAVLLAFGWVMLIVAAGVALTSPGPTLFKQERVGRNGKIFTCYKFRTMHLGTPEVATHQVASNSTTAIGKHLRAWKLDEMPQIFNIFANQMSLVGPRPCLPNQTELIAARVRHDVLRAKPGITGWSQIQGVDMSDPEKLAELDAEYCSRQTLLLYIQIVAMTFLGKGQGDRVR